MHIPKPLIWPMRWTWIGLLAERITQHFWPLWSVLFAAIAVWGTGWLPEMPLVIWAVYAVFASGIVGALWFARHFKMPSVQDALSRLDQKLAGYPIQALMDTQGSGHNDLVTHALWEKHLERMAARLTAARAVEPDLKVARSDPFALRYVAVLTLAVTVLFGGVWRGADLSTGLGANPAQAIQAGPSWEIWLEPPRYTGKPTLYLADIPPGPVEVPVGSQVIVRLYGPAGTLAIEEDISDAPEKNLSDTSQSFSVVRSGNLRVSGDREDPVWSVVALPDLAPKIRPEDMPRHNPPFAMRLPFSAEDDYAVRSAEAHIQIDLDAVDRRYGLAIPPEERPDLILALPLPIVGTRQEFSDVLDEDVSEHPFANLPVTISLRATDDTDQTGQADPFTAELPGHSFFNPLANALAEARRDLLWSRQNQERTSQILRAITFNAAGRFSTHEGFVLTRKAIHALEQKEDFTSARRDSIAETLWLAALREEAGNIDSALARLRQAQERLREAIRQGASQEEIERLMEEMQEAMDNYINQLAQEQARTQTQTDQPDQDREQQEITRDQLEELFDRIQELMEQGRTAEAMQLLEEMQQMLENLEVTQGQNGQGQNQSGTPGQQSMESLRETLRDQQGLSDEAFRRLQESFNNDPGNQPGQEGEPNQGQDDGSGSEPGQGELSDRQQALRDSLNRLLEGLPNMGSEAGNAVEDALDQAGRAMEDATDNLEGDRLADAIDDQARAMDALRDALDQLGRALAQAQQNDQNLGSEQSGFENRAQQQDPLGRRSGTLGNLGTNDEMLSEDDQRRRARDLLDEIRRRSAEQDRSENERDYLNRLLDRF